MDELQLIVGIRGVENLFYQGYKYGRRRNRGSMFITWRCTHYKKLTCEGCVKTSVRPYSNPSVLKEHNHPPDLAELEVEQMRLEMRQKASGSKARPVDVVTTVLNKVSEEAKMSSVSVPTLKRDIRRLRQRRLRKALSAEVKEEVPEEKTSGEESS